MEAHRLEGDAWIHEECLKRAFPGRTGVSCAFGWVRCLRGKLSSGLQDWLSVTLLPWGRYRTRACAHACVLTRRGLDGRDSLTLVISLRLDLRCAEQHGQNHRSRPGFLIIKKTKLQGCEARVQGRRLQTKISRTLGNGSVGQEDEGFSASCTSQWSRQAKVKCSERSTA